MKETNKKMQKNNVVKFVPWNYPTKPSRRARKLIEELHSLGREIFHINGPAIEYRVGHYWLDICFIDGVKFNNEVDYENHDTPEQNEKDKKETSI